MSNRLTMLSLSAALLLALPAAHAENPWVTTSLQDAIARLSPEQQATLKAYESARAAYARRVDVYWRLTELKRKKRKAKIAAGKAVTVEDYVKEQPPVYNGPMRPDEIMALLPKPPKRMDMHRDSEDLRRFVITIALPQIFICLYNP